MGAPNLMYQRWPLVWIVVSVLLYASSDLQAYQDQPRQRTKLQAPHEQSDYFPGGVFSLPNSPVGDSLSAGFSVFLSGIQEPSLFKATNDKDAHSYRILVLESPAANVVAVRLTIRPDGKGEFVFKSSIRNQMNSQVAGSVSVSMVDAFLHAVDQANFWSLSPAEAEPPGFDGTSWVLEGVRGGQYHVAYRLNPKPSCYTAAAKFLLDKIAHVGFAFGDYTCPNK
jgi:hypothetical protein